ncbi:MAG TPA: hypothetical protein VMV77_03920 [Bacteroidales bacterium]|nr:hypothetical protein [Bacteroidales bacterium]
MITIERPTEEMLNKLNVKLWPVWEKGVSEFDWEYDENVEEDGVQSAPLSHYAVEPLCHCAITHPSPQQ